MRSWFYSLSRAKQVTWCVLAAHALMAVALISESWLHKSPPRKAIAVHTVQWAESQPSHTPVSVTVPASGVHSKFATKPASKITPSAKKPAVKKQVITKSHIKPQSPKQAKLLNEIHQTLREIAEPTPPVALKPQLTIPTLAPILSAATTEAPLDNVHERLSAFLQETLQLPEFGEVKIELSVDARGKLTHFKILETKSEKNADFLKNRLPELQFPCFNKSSTLTIVFRNA